MTQRLTSLLGAFCLLLVAYALAPSSSRKAVSFSRLGRGALILFVLGALLLRTPLRIGFGFANAAVEKLLAFSQHGSEFVFGSLVTNTRSFGMIFAFQVLPTIVFFSALISVLYHLRILPFIVRIFGRALSRSLGVSGAESFSTVADVFVGCAEAPLVIRPYIERMTLSELNACMVAGFATTSGSVLAAYVVMLRNYVPGIAGHLIVCSVLCAPASILIAKLLLPETAVPETASASPIQMPRSTANVLDSVAAGTIDGVRLAVNVAAMLIVFLALTHLADWLLAFVGQHVFHASWSLEALLGALFSPLAWLMGAPWQDVSHLGALLGQKTVLNEFVAYSTMSQKLAADPAWLSPRGQLIAAYALCGFANFGTVGIQIAGYSSLAPSRRSDVARIAPRALLGGLLTTCLVACVAGVLA